MGGLDAIESVLDPEAFQRFYDRCGKTGGSGFAGFDAVTGELLEENKMGENLGSREGKIVGIARGDMRSLFMEGCEEYVHFNKHVKGYELTDHGIRALFADGTKSVEGSLWSAVMVSNRVWPSRCPAVGSRSTTPVQEAYMGKHLRRHLKVSGRVFSGWLTIQNLRVGSPSSPTFVPTI